MGWRRGEIWLDTEMLWFREHPSGGAAALALNAPSFFGFAPETVPPVAVANGLAASRQRRADLRRRRNARRTRAAALVLGPAAVLTVAVPRLGSAPRAGGALLEDPPSLTYRLPRADPQAAAARDPRPVASTQAAGATSAPAKPTGASAPVFPEVQWRRGTSHGLPYAGSLTAGTQLPIEGADWVTWNPVADTVPNEPQRLYGNERTIRAIVSTLAAYRAADPTRPRVVVGDLSFQGGGPMEQHRSHQNGLDVDVYYPRLDGWLRAPIRTDQVDRRLAQDLVDRFVAAGAQKVFVGYSTGVRGPSGVVVPYPNHEDHMHVRFRPPPS